MQEMAAHSDIIPELSSTRAPLSTANPADKASVLIAAFAAASIGALLYNVLPLFLGGMQESKQLSSSQTGLLGTAFFFGFNLTGLSAFLWIRRVSWRVMALLTLPAILAVLALSVLTNAFVPLSLITIVCGAVFGVLYTIGSVMVGDSSAPERWYGAKVGLESLAGALVIVIVPATLSGFGFAGTVVGMAVCVVLLAPLLFFLPAAGKKYLAADEGSAVTDAPRRKTNVAAVSLAIFSLLALFASISAIWAFAERMGRLSGFSAESVGALLGVTLIAGVVGSFVVALIGNRIKPLIAFIAATACVLIALVCLGIKGNFALFAVGNCLYMFGWAAGTPLAMAEIARLDRDGRYAAFIAPAIGTGSMIGPGVAGWLIDHSTLSAVFIYSATTLLLSAVALVAGTRMARASGHFID